MVGSDGRFSVIGCWQWAQSERGELSPQHAAPLRMSGLGAKLFDFLCSLPRGVNGVGVLKPSGFPSAALGMFLELRGRGVQPYGTNGWGWRDAAVGNGPSSRFLSWSCRPVAALTLRWAAG